MVTSQAITCRQHSLRGISLVVLVFLSTLRRRRPRRLSRLLLHAMFGPTALRFGLLFSIFAAAYRLLYNGLRIWNPGRRGPGRE